MANAHFGNLADVFKHVTLAQVLARLRPAEYWESHAGSACYEETAPIPAEREHGNHTFLRLAAQNATLRGVDYFQALDKTRSSIMGSALLARRILGERARRLLLCDTDAESLLSIQKHLSAACPGLRDLPPQALECVQDDGISVLRGAGMLLPQAWHASTLAFLDPYDLTAVTDAQITPLDLACELANQSIAVLLFCAYADEADRAGRQNAIRQALTKSRQTSHAVLWEGNLNLPATPKPPTQWGWGMLAINLSPEILQSVQQALAALESAYQSVTLQTPTGAQSGAWTLRRAALG